MRRPVELLAPPDLQAHLDLSKPEFFPDKDALARAVQVYEKASDHTGYL